VRAFDRPTDRASLYAFVGITLFDKDTLKFRIETKKRRLAVFRFPVTKSLSLPSLRTIESRTYRRRCCC
jgi:hypothetical protein